MPEQRVRPTVIPTLTVNDGKAALDFYQRIFGAQQPMSPMLGPNGKIMHAELAFGDQRVFVSDEFPEMGVFGPKHLGGTPVTIELYVADVDKTFAAATSAGAEVRMPPADMFWGDRYCQIIDPWGHRWGLATHKEDVSREEMERRAKVQMAEWASKKS